MTFYLHIPKTAGTTLRHYVGGRYAPGELVESYAGELAFWPVHLDFVESLRRRPEVRAIYGHYSYGVHLLLGKRHCRYVTLLREPAGLLVSFFLHQSREPQARFYEAIRKGMRLRDLITDGAAPECNNFMVRILAVETNLIEAHLGPEWETRTDPERWRELRPAIGSLTGMDMGPRGPYDQIFHAAHLERAWANLDRHFCLVGIAEQCLESMRRLAALMGWPLPADDLRLNTSPQPHPALDDQTLEIIRRYNSLDYALYERAKQRFEAAPAAAR